MRGCKRVSDALSVVILGNGRARTCSRGHKQRGCDEDDRASGYSLLFEGIRAGQVSERGAHFSADSSRRLWNDIGDLPIGAHTFRMQPSDCDSWIPATEGPLGKLQAFRFKPSPAFGWHLLQFSFLLHGRSAGSLGV